MTKLLVLISHHEEGPLLASAIRSAEQATKDIYELGGPVGEGCEWATDAEKRNAMLAYARRQQAEWILWLDADELLVWGEYLLDYIYRAEAGDDDLHVHGGFPIRIVEQSGYVSQSAGRIMRLALIEKCLVSSVEVKLWGQEASMAFGNIPNWAPALRGNTGEIVRDADPVTPYCRPPNAGEPHIYHRPELRDPRRSVERQSEAESADFAARAQRLGIALP